MKWRPIPGPRGLARGLLSMLDIFSGGALSQFSVVAMGVYPYITASIIMQLLTAVIEVNELQKRRVVGKLDTVRATLNSGRSAILDAINAATKDKH